MAEKHIELARKLKALADRGEGGEKENAEDKLAAYMLAHGISYAALEEDQVDLHQFNFQSALYCHIGQQILSTVLGNNYMLLQAKHAPRYRPFVECTWAQFIEAQAKIDFYIPLFRAAKKDFELAFIITHALWPLKTEQNAPAKQPSSDELELRSRAMVMSMGMKPAVFRKQLDGPGKNPATPDTNSHDNP